MAYLPPRPLIRQMAGSLHGVSGAKLPIWLKLVSTVVGILFAGLGMSSFISGGSMKTVLIPLFVGAMMIYIAGYERKMYIDERGLSKEVSFWGQKTIRRVPWESVDDAKIILNKGRKIYAIFHGNMPAWPYTFQPEQEKDLIETLSEYLEAENIVVNR